LFDSKYFLIINFPRGTSGKFLANCLGISDGATLQDKNLVNLTSKEKLSLLMTRLKNIKGRWNDLELGDYGLFESGTFKYNDPTAYPIEVIQALENKKYVVRINHNPYHTINLTNTWRNAKVIDFVDIGDYLDHRPSIIPFAATIEEELEEYWDHVRDVSWPINPPEYVEDLNNLPEHIKFDLKELFDNAIFGLLKNRSPIPRSTITWNPNWFLGKNLFLEKLYNLYNILELPDYNEDYISTFYDEYIKVAKIIL